MRKAQKQDILETVITLHEAHDEIKNYIEKRNYVCAQDMLIQCQECAISIGNVIESLEGEGFVTVPFIEEYCDYIYHVHEDLNSGMDSNANKIYKNMKKQLLRIENSIKNDVHVRKEIAFFPYKASMWDSLESIYLAAKEDPDCDAYCVPIPYFDLNPDHSFGEMHYEGREYPKNIEVIDWQTYNFEERKPDAIYIHNPYDNWNLVTSVHPRYYSDKLKKCTEELVYVPYFILQEIEPDNQTAIDGMKHFIWTPGVINADKVIVQSEKMAQIYVNEFQKAAMANNLPSQYTDKSLLEKKFLGLGSPKIDKVLNTKKEDLEIPQEWLKIIEKPDGTWKKIIFYNTSIAALLEHNDKMLEKMKDVFRIFHENKDEVALLWRPHPLIENTVKSMRPQLWTEYKKIVDWYKEEGWGIYDDTADMDRAVVISDAYYGDPSSVVQVYQKTGKLVMVQNILLKMSYKSTENINIDALCFENLYDDGKYYWGTEYYFNGLFKINKQTMNVEYVGAFPNEKMLGMRLYTDIIEYNDKLYFTPMGAKEVGVYDKKNNVISKLSFDDLKIGFLEGCSSWSYYSAHLYKDTIYFLPHERCAILKYNISDEKFSASYSEISQIIDNYKLSSNRLMFKSVLVNDCIYAPISGCNLLEVIDLKNEVTKIYEIGEEGNEYFDICQVEEQFVIAPLQGNKIIIWSYNQNDVSEIELERDKSAKYQCSSLIMSKDGIVVFPYQYGEILKLRKKKESKQYEIENRNEIQENVFNKIECRYWGLDIGSEDGCFAFDMHEQKLIEFDSKLNIINETILRIKDKKKWRNMIMQKALLEIRNSEIFSENSVFSITELVYILK